MKGCSTDDRATERRIPPDRCAPQSARVSYRAGTGLVAPSRALATSNARCCRVTLTAQIRCPSVWLQAVNAPGQLPLNGARAPRAVASACADGLKSERRTDQAS